jgi:hypothetical protein
VRLHPPRGRRAPGRRIGLLQDGPGQPGGPRAVQRPPPERGTLLAEQRAEPLGQRRPDHQVRVQARERNAAGDLRIVEPAARPRLGGREFVQAGARLREPAGEPAHQLHRALVAVGVDHRQRIEPVLGGA